MHSSVMTLALLLLAPVPGPFQVGTPQVVGQQHWVSREGKRLSLWERTLESTVDEVAVSGRVVVFLHGATWSGRPDFDLQVPGYSTMEAMAVEGWDTFCLDVQGYGQSDDPEGDNFCEARDAALDLHAAVEYLRLERSVERVHLIGWSWGSQVVGLYAEQHPERVGRLVLYGSRWQALDVDFEAPTDRFRWNDAEGAASDFVEGCYEEEMLEAYVAAALEADPSSPNGCLRDYFEGLPILSPEEIVVPTMVLLGEHEARDKQDDQLRFFAELPSFDKRFVVLPGGGHAIHLENPRARWWSAVLEFLEG